jgi:antitoxin component YwqK of YwqJK toxin-antitoxin module
MIRYQLSIKEYFLWILIFTFCMLYSCKSLTKKGNYSVDFYENGNIRQLTVSTKGYKQIYEFDSTGICKKIGTQKNSFLEGEQLSFYRGALIQKIWYKSGIPSGLMYDYYPTTGALKSFRQVKNGLEKGLGIDYYNMTVPVVKSSLYFNDKGEIYFKQNFDSLSNFIGEEGKKPDFLK